jgi:eukaryotic-like serine/threonine-protein kinase
MAGDRVGQLVVNRYQLFELIGLGAMGQVYRGKDTRTGKWIAIKFLMQDLLSPQMCDRFETEALISAQLGQHSLHIVDVTDYGTDDQNVPFYVMEYLPGHSLSRLIATSTFSLARFLHLTRQICLGLEIAHRGIVLDSETELVKIVHRDIKPSNIFVSHDPSVGEVAKILDFGIATLLKTDHSTSQTYTGTLAYSSPEQLAGEPLDHRSDLYSLGLMMFEMLSGHSPIIPHNHNFASWCQAHTQQIPRSLHAANGETVPQSLEAVIMACLAKQPSDRPQSIIEVLTVLNPLCEQYRSAGLMLALKLAIPEALTMPESPGMVSPDQLRWPQEVRPQKIVVPRQVSSAGKTSAAIWVMLPHQQIQTLQIHRPYTQIYHCFLFAPTSQYPLVLWLTAAYNRRLGAKWFPAFLDVQAKQHLDLIDRVIQDKQYQVLLFDLEPPYGLTHRIEVQISTEQSAELQYWLVTRRSQPTIGLSADNSKQLLRNAYQILKRKIEQDWLEDL